MNDVYQNCFIPQHKCIKVERVRSKYRLTYYKPQAPYQRLFYSGGLIMIDKQHLIERYNSLDPIDLRKALHFQLKRFRRIF